MNKNRHLLQEERNIIEQRLIKKASFKSIGRELGKDPTTIAKEIRNHLHFKKTGCYGKPFNDCLMRRDCGRRHLCGNRRCHRYCCFCNTYPCSTLCPDYHQQICSRLSKPPLINSQILHNASFFIGFHFNYLEPTLWISLNPGSFCVLRQSKQTTKGFVFFGHWDSTSAPGGKPPMSCGISVPNSFVLPILEMERQSCSLNWVIALKDKFNPTAPTLNC
jgi:hypothetical protein